MYNMDLEIGGGALNNQQQVQPQQGGGEEEGAGGGGGGDDYQLATPDPAKDFPSCGEIAVLCVVAVVMSSLGALLLGLAFATIPLQLADGGQELVFQSGSDQTAFVTEFTSGVVALGIGCGAAAVLAMLCCRGSHSPSLD